MLLGEFRRHANMAVGCGQCSVLSLGKPCVAPKGLDVSCERGPTASAVGYPHSSLTGQERGARDGSLHGGLRCNLAHVPA